ncbi:MAG TPA: M14 family zinc carboxypeptidase [Solirubrobacterales bacterium]|nr:M14 family zinc carboxypeptidase [Solirubrobacterales bacterium]
MRRAMKTPRALLGALASAAAVAALIVPGSAAAAVDPLGCTPTLQYDSSVPTFTQFATEHGYEYTTLGGFDTGTKDRHVAAQLYAYEEAIARATENNPRVRVLIRNMGPTAEGRDFQYSVIGTPEHIANLESDAAFWRGVRGGEISTEEGLAKVRSANPPAAFGWITETPHGNEPAGGEASMRMLYELAAREDCSNARRLQTMDFFIDPARNPDGRDNNTRTTAWSFDPNRDLMYQTQDVNQTPLEDIFQYPSLFFIDAHQQSTGYFFPPNEDPVHHEISHFSLDLIQDVIGPALQARFNDQSLQYRNYNDYDLFTPEYGDSVPSLILGGAGMTYEKGSSENYGKQVYDHYLAMDETANVVSKEAKSLSEGWVEEWAEAKKQGSECEVQENELISPLHESITQQPDISICGYYFKPGLHSGDTAHILRLLQNREVKVYRLSQPVTVSGAHDWGKNVADTDTTTETLPAGTLYIPDSQTMKHWINATLEENPYIPYPYYYDVVDWAFSQLSDAAGNGQLQAPLPAGTPMEEVGPEGPGLGKVEGFADPVYAFSTDSTEGLGLVTELVAKGATVYRSGEAFEADGVKFSTGAAYVDASSLGGLDLASMAARRETPVYGLPSYPTAHYVVPKPRIAIYAGTSVPTNLLFPGTGSGHCTSTAFCEALFTLAEEDGIPVNAVNGLIRPITTAEVIAGGLVTTSGGVTKPNYTALVSPGTEIPAGTAPTAAEKLQEFVNLGGNFVTYGKNGATGMRNAAISKLNTAATTTWNAHCPDNTNPAAAGTLTTPGTTFSAEFDTDDPVAWGFDEGGYIFRDSSSTTTDPVFDQTTLTGEGAIPTATAAASYATSLQAYGYQCNGLEAEHLPGRPYVVDQPYGSGHATVIGSDPFFRAWNSGAQRLVINAILYPGGAAIPASAPVGMRVVRAAAKPVAESKLGEVESRPAVGNPTPNADVVVTVKAANVPKLKRIVRKAKLPKKVAKRVHWVKEGNGKESLRIVGASQFARDEPGDPSTKGDELWIYNDLELRPTWAWRIIHGIVGARLHTYEHQI